MLVSLVEITNNVRIRKKTKSFRKNCPFSISLRVSEDGKSLNVVIFEPQHNHPFSEETYKHLPRQRAINLETIEQVKRNLQIQGNAKLIQRKVERNTGKNVTLKDISNIKQRMKYEISKNDLEPVVNFLKSKANSTVEVFVSKENEFLGILYQDEYMKNVCNMFPEILLVDATYKLRDLRSPVYLLLAVDGNGLSEMVALFILTEETKETIQIVLNVFKVKNESWEKTKVIMSDKDFVEREAFKDCFTNASLLICLYHTLRSFRREVTCEKKGITSAQRLDTLEILQKITYSKNDAEYAQNIE